MADPLMVVGAALIDVLREGLFRLRPRAHALLERLREAAEPPEGVSLRADDGATYTGLVLVDHNRVVMMLTARQEPILVSRPGERPPLITPPATSPQRPFHQRPLFEAEEGTDWEDDGRYGRFR